jgi:PTS system nitrogen regulatory IIA component
MEKNRMNKKKDPHFYHFLAEGNIICNLKSEDRDDAIEELTERLIKNTAGLELEETVDAVIAREKLAPTVISPGLAIPHARMANVKQLLIALGTSREGIDFHAPRMQKVNVVILILTPKDDPGLHLQVLAALGQDFKNPETVKMVSAFESPEDVLRFFSETNIEMPEYLMAKHVMNSQPITLLESDSIETAIDTFATKKILDIPIIDNVGDIRGILAIEDLLRHSLPEHLLWMDDLSPILHFQPFAETLKSDKETKIADFMQEQFVSIDESVPAIQLAKIFLMKNIRQIIVTNNGKLTGVVNINGFITKLFWA